MANHSRKAAVYYTIRVIVSGCDARATLADTNIAQLEWVLDSQGPSAERKGAKAKSGEILKRLGHKNLKLTEYEGALRNTELHVYI